MTIYPTLARDFGSGPMAAAHASCQGGLPISIENRYQRGMSKGDEERAKRLAEALRQNLRRRKVQEREEKGEDKKPEDSRGPCVAPRYIWERDTLRIGFLRGQIGRAQVSTPVTNANLV